MDSEIQSWLERISTGEKSLKRMYKELEESEEREKLTPAEIREQREVEKGFTEGYPKIMKELGFVIGGGFDDDELTEEELREGSESLQRHAEEVHEELGIPIEAVKKVQETVRESIKEGLMRVGGKLKTAFYEPAKATQIEVLSGLYVDINAVREGSEATLEWLRENGQVSGAEFTKEEIREGVREVNKGGIRE